MRRLTLAGLLLVAGCQNVIGPFQQREPRRVDDPCLSIAEQKRLGRDRLALPESSPSAGPPTDVNPRDVPQR